ncbi:unnamed protein product [Lactuca saligna]|uniref:Uncharacterized protein n=1 Tax=Lactuca saligna TaxID=75948 RepID=A0AA35V2Q4_LACSI|nr:unnamed protein product [Lactuca saligna]
MLSNPRQRNRPMLKFVLSRQIQVPASPPPSLVVLEIDDGRRKREGEGDEVFSHQPCVMLLKSPEMQLISDATASSLLIHPLHIIAASGLLVFLLADPDIEAQVRKTGETNLHHQ